MAVLRVLSPRSENMFRLVLLTVMLLATTHCQARHACEDEVRSACPDRPGSEMAKCLKDKSEHENPTTISSECADFIALNSACAEDISKFCDEAFFSDDTTLCLGEWTPQRNLSPKCAKVVEWAIPKPEGQEDGPTDELGMSEKDYREKLEWQKARKEARGEAIEKINEKQREKELEALKKEDPVAYKQLMDEQEAARASFEELKRRQRLQRAAEERKKGKNKEDETPEQKKERLKQERIQRLVEQKRAKEGGNWLPYVLGGLFVAFIFFNILNFFQKDKEDEKDD
eukprot:TRINITY_DN7682_c0_g1_i1.p1 TRINITY_DN7682_c0_g1~~TRINITY_DN7682_c0_g1_i1.p1  ORF type:complete len:286 (+),score=84.89 TRINITY_DN7682_c0_g1_i1:184-1041(+)